MGSVESKLKQSSKERVSCWLRSRNIRHLSIDSMGEKVEIAHEFAELCANDITSNKRNFWISPWVEFWMNLEVRGPTRLARWPVLWSGSKSARLFPDQLCDVPIDLYRFLGSTGAAQSNALETRTIGYHHAIINVAKRYSHIIAPRA